MNNEEAIDLLSKIQRRIRLWTTLAIKTFIIFIIFGAIFVETKDNLFLIGFVAFGMTSLLCIYAIKAALSDFASVGKKLNEGE